MMIIICYSPFFSFAKIGNLEIPPLNLKRIFAILPVTKLDLNAPARSCNVSLLADNRTSLKRHSCKIMAPRIFFPLANRSGLCARAAVFAERACTVNYRRWIYANYMVEFFCVHSEFRIVQVPSASEQVGRVLQCLPGVSFITSHRMNDWLGRWVERGGFLHGFLEGNQLMIYRLWWDRQENSRNNKKSVQVIQGASQSGIAIIIIICRRKTVHPIPDSVPCPPR